MTNRYYNLCGHGRREGRGRGDKKSNNKRASNNICSKEYRFRPHGKGKARQLVTYSKILDIILNNIQKNYDNGADVVNSLRVLTPFDMDKVRPTRSYASDLPDDGEDPIQENEEDKETAEEVAAKEAAKVRRLKRMQEEFNKVVSLAG